MKVSLSNNGVLICKCIEIHQICCYLFLPELCSASLLMTSPSVVRDLLMLEPSLSLSPLAPVLLALSDPARSTREILDTLEPVTPESVSLKEKSNNLFVVLSDIHVT